MWWKRSDGVFGLRSELYAGAGRVRRHLGCLERSDRGWEFCPPAHPEIFIPGTEFMGIDEAEVVTLAYLRLTGVL